jgi:hypothetical protein
MQSISDTFLSNDILSVWKNLRKKLTTDLSDLEQIQMVLKFWSVAPLQLHVTDFDNPNLWPTPWELISNKNYDESAIAIAMMYTLLLGYDKRWSKNNLKLIFATDKVHSIQQIMLVVDKTWLLNYEYNQITDWNYSKNNLQVQHQYHYNEITNKFSLS